MHKKIEKTFLVFEIIACVMGSINLCLFGIEHLSTAVIVLTNSLNLWHMYKKYFL